MYVDDREKPALPLQRLRCALLIYLAAEKEVSRETLLTTFWPDKPPSRARHILSQSIYELRRALGDDAVGAEGDRIRAGPDVRIDVHEFERNLEQGNLAAAIDMYGGPFLAGFPLPNTNGFETWADRKRATLERLHRKAQRDRIQALESSGDLVGALAAARSWAELEPLEDEAQHKLLELLLGSGARVEAKAHFEQYQRLLREELDVAPLDETVALFERSGDSLPSQPAIPAERGPPAAPPSQPKPAQPSGGVSARIPWRLRLAQHRRRALAVLAVAVVISSALLVQLTVDRSPGLASLELPIDSGGLDPSRIAVLYFEDHSENQALGPLANGLTEMLIHELSQVEALNVVSRHGVKPFAGRDVSLDSVVDALHVGTLVDGTVQSSGDLLRVTVQLIEARTGMQLESDTLQRPMGGLFELQDDIAHRVARFLRERLRREITLRRLRTEGRNVEAWILVQRALDMGAFTWESETALPVSRTDAARRALESAESLLIDAERNAPDWMEPTLLRGWAALGRAKLFGTADTAAYDMAINEGLRHAERLLRRHPNDARGLELRGTLRLHLFRAQQTRPDAATLLATAEQDLTRAIAGDRPLASAFNTLSRLRQYAGDSEQANYYAVQALERDAYLQDGAEILQRLFRTSLDLKDVDQAHEWCLDGRANYPEDRRFLECQLAIPALTGRRLTEDSARVILRALDAMDPPRTGGGARFYRHTYRQVLLIRVLIANRQLERARDILNRIRRDVSEHPELAGSFAFDDAHIALALGDTLGALGALQRFVAGHPFYRNYVRSSFLFEPLREHPRFGSLIASDSAR